MTFLTTRMRAPTRRTRRKTRAKAFASGLDPGPRITHSMHPPVTLPSAIAPAPIALGSVADPHALDRRLSENTRTLTTKKPRHASDASAASSIARMATGGVSPPTIELIVVARTIMTRRARCGGWEAEPNSAFAVTKNAAAVTNAAPRATSVTRFIAAPIPCAGHIHSKKEYRQPPQDCELNSSIAWGMQLDIVVRTDSHAGVSARLFTSANPRAIATRSPKRWLWFFRFGVTVYCMVPVLGTQFRKGVAEFCILGLLSKEPMYGWELSTRLQADGLIASMGTLYPLLGRLRDRGSITSSIVPSKSGPSRKYYSLTPRGVAELDSFTRAWFPFVSTVSSVLGGVRDD